tara:strand:+ start:3430 stop:3804 length:375 start_codon:yes stop_codon:yes gene_type:complete
MLNKTIYPSSISNLEDLRRAKQYHQVKLIEKEALIRANISILKSQYERKPLFSLFKKGTSTDEGGFSIFKQGTDLLIDYFLGGKSPMIRMFSKNLVSILSKNYQTQIQSVVDRIMRTFNAIINK